MFTLPENTLMKIVLEKKILLFKSMDFWNANI